MLLQTNSYVVPKEKRTEHARLMQRFRQTMLKLGCDSFEVYEQTAANWAGSEAAGRFVQMMRFRDRKHQQAVQAAERSDQSAQQLIKEFVELINFPYQQQQGYFATGYYHCLVSTGAAASTGEADASVATDGESAPGDEASSAAGPAEDAPADEVQLDDESDSSRTLPNL